MRLLLVADNHSYNLESFERTATSLGAETVVATDRCHVLAAGWAAALGDRVLALNLRDPAEAVAELVRYAAHHPLAALLSLSDKTTEIAARAAAALGLPHNDPNAARAARSKIAMREALARGGVAQPRFEVFDFDEAAEAVAARVAYPCVLKPALLAASRGVIRADGPVAFATAWKRLGAILRAPELLADGDPDARRVLVEEYVPGAELALEGLLRGGVLEILAIFDKPEPLVGPFFEETLYVTPARLPAPALERATALTRAAARALELVDGPLHAELRISGEHAWMIEVAARTIGGLCSRTLRFGTGMGLEELIVRHSLRLPIPTLERERSAAGAMMLPIPRGGLLKAVEGVEEARAVPLVEEVEITIQPGEEVVPLPEGNRYLGFLFARGPTPQAVEAALRSAHACLRFGILPRLAAE